MSRAACLACSMFWAVRESERKGGKREKKKEKRKRMLCCPIHDSSLVARDVQLSGLSADESPHSNRKLLHESKMQIPSAEIECTGSRLISASPG